MSGVCHNLPTFTGFAVQVLGCVRAFKPFRGIADGAPAHQDRVQTETDVTTVSNPSCQEVLAAYSHYRFTDQSLPCSLSRMLRYEKAGHMHSLNMGM